MFNDTIMVYTIHGGMPNVFIEISNKDFNNSQITRWSSYPKMGHFS